MKQTLESEYTLTIKWFHENKIIVNPDKFDKRKPSNTEVTFITGSEQIQAVPSVDILGITIDDKLNFNLQIDKMCLKSVTQLNAFYGMKKEKS